MLRCVQFFTTALPYIPHEGLLDSLWPIVSLGDLDADCLVLVSLNMGTWGLQLIIIDTQQLSIEW